MINMDNYEGYLYLYQEGELDSTTRTEVERFLLEHPDIREEMETFYDPTLVVTAEPPARKTHRIIPLLRWAAAACIVFALSYGLWATLPTSVDSGNESLVAENKTPQPQNQPKPSDSPTAVKSTPIATSASTNQRVQRKNPSLHSTNTSVPDVQPHETDAETIVPVREAIEPAYTEPTIIYCQLAEEIIPVDNLAEEIIFVDNLAEVKTATSINEMIIDFADSRKQQFIDYIKEEFFTLVTKKEIAQTI